MELAVDWYSGCRFRFGTCDDARRREPLLPPALLALPRDRDEPDADVARLMAATVSCSDVVPAGLVVHACRLPSTRVCVRVASGHCGRMID